MFVIFKGGGFIHGKIRDFVDLRHTYQITTLHQQTHHMIIFYTKFRAMVIRVQDFSMVFKVFSS